jgi:Leucine-rich repeat (LRR) protein
MVSNMEAPESVTKVRIYFKQFDRMISGIGEHFFNLEELVMDTNHLKFIKAEDFSNMTNLKRMNLGYNSLKIDNENVFEKLKNLEELKLHVCKLFKLPSKIFSHHRNLKTILLFGNYLTHLERSLFINNLNLEYVDLNKNKLKQIDVDFTNFPKIKKVNLENNICINEFYDVENPKNSTVSSVQELQQIISRNCTKNKPSILQSSKFSCSSRQVNSVFPEGYSWPFLAASNGK